MFEEYLGETIDPQGPNCCCDSLANTCPDPCSPDYEPGTSTDCAGKELKNCLFGYNDNGQPIVETPYHAIKSFVTMDIDSMVIGDFIVDK